MEPNASQPAVFLLFGRCLMRLQQYELLMKRLIATGSVTTSVSGQVPLETKSPRSLPTCTLGLLAGEFFRSVVVVEGGSQDTNQSAGFTDQDGVVITTTYGNPSSGPPLGTSRNFALADWRCPGVWEKLRPLVASRALIASAGGRLRLEGRNDERLGIPA